MEDFTSWISTHAFLMEEGFKPGLPGSLRRPRSTIDLKPRKNLEKLCQITWRNGIMSHLIPAPTQNWDCSMTINGSFNLEWNQEKNGMRSKNWENSWMKTLKLEGKNMKLTDRPLIPASTNNLYLNSYFDKLKNCYTCKNLDIETYLWFERTQNQKVDGRGVESGRFQLDIIVFILNSNSIFVYHGYFWWFEVEVRMYSNKVSQTLCNES